MNIFEEQHLSNSFYIKVDDRSNKRCWVINYKRKSIRCNVLSIEKLSLKSELLIIWPKTSSSCTSTLYNWIIHSFVLILIHNYFRFLQQSCKNLSHISLGNASYFNGSHLAALCSSCLQLEGNIVRDICKHIYSFVNCSTELRLRNVFVSEIAFCHHQTLSKLNKLVTLDLYSTNISTDLLIPLLEVNPNLRYLNLGKSIITNTVYSFWNTKKIYINLNGYCKNWKKKIYWNQRLF